MASHLQHLFPNLSLELVRLPSQAVTTSTFLLLPTELRLRIYEFVFSYPVSNDIPPLASQQLVPLLTCRQVYQEAKHLAFYQTIHCIDCTWHTNIQRQLLVLDPSQVPSIRH